MPRQHYDAAFKAQAMKLVRQQAKPASAIADELGVPRKTLYHWMEAVRKNPAEPFVGTGHLRADDQRVRDLERANRDLQEENAILKKATHIFANGPK